MRLQGPPELGLLAVSQRKLTHIEGRHGLALPTLVISFYVCDLTGQQAWVFDYAVSLN